MTNQDASCREDKFMSGYRNHFEYRGYTATVQYSANEQLWHGKIDGIKDLVIFSSENFYELQKSLEEAIDNYIALCAEIGKAPDITPEKFAKQMARLAEEYKPEEFHIYSDDLMEETLT